MHQAAAGHTGMPDRSSYANMFWPLRQRSRGWFHVPSIGRERGSYAPDLIYVALHNLASQIDGRQALERITGLLPHHEWLIPDKNSDYLSCWAARPI